MSRVWDKSKPPIGPWTLNRDSPLAQGLVLWVPLAGPSGGTYWPDLSDPPLNNTAAVAPTTLDAWGAPAVVGNGSSTYIRFGSPAKLNITGDYTLITRIAPAELSTRKYIAAQYNSGGNQSQIAAEINREAARLSMLATGYAVGCQGATALTLNKWVQVAFRCVGTTYSIWIDGALDNSTTTAGARQGQQPFALGRAGDYVGSASYFNGSFSETAIYGRGLSDDEIRTAHSPGQRFELWYPLRSRRWISGGAAGPVTVNATSGAWSWAGVRAPLSTQIAAAQGAWSWAGPSAKLSTQIPATSGAWSWAGQVAKLSTQVAATVGAWSWAGTSAKLGAQLNAVAGAWTWAGQSAALQTQVAGVPGTWTWAGTAATLVVSGTLNATSGSWAWAGTAASLAHQVTSTAGVWTWAGTAATVFTTPQLNATVGGWSWVGQATTFSSMVAAAPGTYSWSGVSASVPPPPAPAGPPVKMIFSMAERRGRGRVVTEQAPGSMIGRRSRFRTEGS